VKPIKISQLSLAFVLVVTTLALILATYMVRKMDGFSDTVQLQEHNAARDELLDALTGLDQKLQRVGEQLADWDETRQQLVFDEYYTLWRDDRVRDAGYIPVGMDIVALYDKQGWILRPSPSDEYMPDRVADTDGAVFLVSDQYSLRQGYPHVYFFHPVYADPNRTIGMGFVGLKFDLLLELSQVRSFRFLDLNGLQLEHAPLTSTSLVDLIDHIDYQAQPNHAVEMVGAMFERELLHMLLFVVAILALASLLLHRIMVRPLRAISKQIDRLQEPTDNLPPRSASKQPLPITELEHVRRSFNDYQQRLAELHHDLEQSSQDFYRQARRDALTGVFNRRAMDEDWQLSQPESSDTPCALMLFDCDHFKAINDSYGHDVGDSVIKGIATSLSDSLRSGDRLYRIGGDEFATFLPDTDRDTAQAIAERCLEQVQAHDFRRYGLCEPLGVSIGLTVTDKGNPPRSISELQKQADLAMYTAKRPGNRKVALYHEDLGEVAPLVANRTMTIVFDAIRDPGLLRMHYQPIVSLPGADTEYTEALVRIGSDGDTRLTPADIFPIVSSRRLDTEFDLAVIQAVQQDMHSGRVPGGQGVSINISAPGIVHAKVITALLALRSAEPDHRIVIEITETALITQIATASNHLRTLRQAGCLIALDDFGSGYSSLRYLSSMPVDLVKFDISMIRLLDHQQAHQRAITEKIAVIVKDAGYQIVAEGIETEAMLAKVEAIGFDFAQGFLFSEDK